MRGPRKNIPNKRGLLASADLERLGVNPIEYLVNVYKEAMEGYHSGRGVSEKGDNSSSYLAVAARVASDLAKFKHPTLSAIALKDISDYSDQRGLPMTTAEAVKIIQSDPFAPDEFAKIETASVIEAMESQIETPMLPLGAKDE